MDSSRLTYDWVKRTREVLFDYTEALPNDVYTLEHTGFAYGSVRNIHAHVAGCYRFWVGQMGLQEAQEYPEPSSLVDTRAMRHEFAAVDALLEQAFNAFDRLDEPLEVIRPGHDTARVTQRWLITHPITHEFHHKGQLLALGRILGHPLPIHMDTDLVLPFE